jgi:hypothetical protein
MNVNFLRTLIRTHGQGPVRPKAANRQRLTLTAPYPHAHENRACNGRAQPRLVNGVNVTLAGRPAPIPEAVAEARLIGQVC